MIRTPAPASALALPPDIRAMNLVAAGVLALAGAALVAAGGAWVARRPYFAFRSIALEGDLQHTSVATLRANALPHLTGNFFTMDLQQARTAFEQVPWVRQAVVRRVWPDRLVVRLEEHRPVALWTADESTDRLVDSHGDVFEANVGDVEDQGLPDFDGPEGSAAQMLAMYDRLRRVLAPLDSDIATLALSDRGSWRVELEDGAAIELGRGADDEVVDRTARFVRTLPQVLARYNAPLETADLRHADGYAVKLKGVTVTPGSDTVPRNAVQVPVTQAAPGSPGTH